jgi:hypothetical protein
VLQVPVRSPGRLIIPSIKVGNVIDCGILQADAYGEYNDLYLPSRRPGPVTEAGCWAHARRNFFKLAERARAPLAVEAVRRIDLIFDAERLVNGLSIDQRLVVRKETVAPLVAELETWMRSTRGKMSRHADVAKVIDYMLKRWDAFSRFLNDGRICLTTDGVEKPQSAPIRCFSVWPKQAVFLPQPVFDPVLRAGAVKHGRRPTGEAGAQRA